MTFQEHQKKTLDFLYENIQQQTKLIMEQPMTRETRLACAVFEASQWLRDGAPGKALEVLEGALKP